MTNPTNFEKEKMISQATILDMGWTKALIAKFLPEPTLKDNPYYKKAAPMKLWSENVVMEIMDTADFKAAAEKAAKRKQAVSVKIKEEKLTKQMEQVCSRLTVKIVPEDCLIQRAINARNNWRRQIANGRGDLESLIPICASDVDKATLDRWVVNYIRHNLVHYDKAIAKMDGKTGKYEVYPQFKAAVLKKIAAAYPAYAEECKRQIDEL